MTDPATRRRTAAFPRHTPVEPCRESTATRRRRHSTRGGKARQLVPALIAACLGVFAGAAQGAEKFEKLAVYLEQNIQDKDAEVKFEVIGTSVGLAMLQVAAPDGRIVVDFKAPASKLGIRHLTLESPEPANDGKLQADFPPGNYIFTGTTVTGETLVGEAVLTHGFPKSATLIQPRPDERNVAVTGLRIIWGEVKDAAAVTVLIEQEETGRTLSASLAATANTFAVPTGFLTGGTTYKLAIGTIARGGNKTITETSFTTAGGAKH